MKVLCDVCKGEEAAVYCCADEAALCAPCDARVHRANKLAGKHRRFSLLHPASPQQLPLCDICQEKRALLFCQEDRAILCRDCDAPIHTANDLTQKHSRFLLTGIKLSPSATPAAASSPSASDGPSSVAVSSTISNDAEEPPGDITKQQKKPAAAVPPVAVEMSDKSSRAAAAAAADLGTSGKVMAEGLTSNHTISGGGGGSRISEYLMKELPGWHVEDLLLDASPAGYPFSKMAGDDLMPFLEADLDTAAFPSDDAGNPSAWWVPQVPQVPPPALPPLPPSHGFGQQRQQPMGVAIGSELSKLAARQLQQHNQQHHHQQQRWASDDCFTVPEISTVQPHRLHTPPSYKRPRPSSWCMSS